MIEAIGLHKAFGPVVAVDNLSFEARDGRVTGLLGPNGSGKTTTLRLLCTILVPDRGQACVDGIDAAVDPRAVRARIGALPESRGLYPRLTARENVRYFGRLHGLRGEALESTIDRLGRRLEMQAILDRRVEGFSSGERVKVALARALVHAPRNVILDEPTTGLDVSGTRGVRTLIRRLRDEGHCLLFSSHIMQEVSALCDDIVVVSKGRAAAAGSPADLMQATGQSQLEDAFVAIIGSEEGLG
ncbi:MAG: ATP-binding cassette domain-containing protein [Caldilineae bacterium]|nr:ATP-binding cassette domain-containing protein [Chloroflexota bacterium]MCB9175731.1 ATP-binding cassette domain-containing protein [Caldilineae bacterium]